MALNGLICAQVPLRNYSLTHSLIESGRAVKVKVRRLDIAPFGESSPQKGSGMARVLEGSLSFTCTPTRSWNGPHLPLPSQL